MEAGFEEDLEHLMEFVRNLGKERTLDTKGPDDAEVLYQTLDDVVKSASSQSLPTVRKKNLFT